MKKYMKDDTVIITNVQKTYPYSNTDFIYWIVTEKDCLFLK